MRRSVPDEIVDTLRDRILSGRYRVGQRLPPERQLSNQLGTNRNTLREALRALDAQGLIRARHGDGIRVLDFHRTGEMGLLPHYFANAAPAAQLGLLGDLFRLRTMVSEQFVQLSAERAGADDIQRLKELIARLSEAHQKHDVRALALTELDLYRVLIECSGSLAVLWLFNSIEKVTHRFLDKFQHLWVVPPTFVERWTAVVAAVAAHEPKEARDELSKLFAENDQVVLDAIALLSAEVEAQSPRVADSLTSHG